jgi:hypothetical protein
MPFVEGRRRSRGAPTHGLLMEDLPARAVPVNPKLAEAWRATVDA